MKQKPQPAIGANTLYKHKVRPVNCSLACSFKTSTHIIRLFFKRREEIGLMIPNVFDHQDPLVTSVTYVSVQNILSFVT